MKKTLVLFLILISSWFARAQFNHSISVGWTGSFSPNMGFQSVFDRFLYEHPNISQNIQSPHFANGITFGWAGTFGNKFMLAGNIDIRSASEHTSLFDSINYSFTPALFQFTLNYDFGILMFDSRHPLFLGISSAQGIINYTIDTDLGKYDNLDPYLALSPFIEQMICFSDKAVYPAITIRLFYQQSLIPDRFQYFNDNINTIHLPVKRNYHSNAGIRISFALVRKDDPSINF
jgi:hypothetical protein